MKKNSLLVSEVFYSLQGEGSTMGIPAVFLRLSGCNLLCDGAWRCDTIEVWQKGDKIEFENIIHPSYIDRLKAGAHLIITGGEPLLQADRIINYLEWFYGEYGFLPYIEVETNGTRLPNKKLQGLVDLWNVSPKLRTSGMSQSKRLNLVFLFHFDKINSIFKFVISSKEDWMEIYDLLVMPLVIHLNKIWLMPAASTIDQLLEKNKLVSQIALEKQVNFCTRLQIEIWNKTTGV